MSLPFLHIEAPLYVAWCILGSVVSSIPVGIGVFRAMLGQLPDPNVTGSWSFYGVLIAAIIVLFSCGIVFIRWFFSFWLKKQEDMNDKTVQAMLAMAKALDKNTDVTNKQNDWFDKFAQEGLREHLGFPKKLP